MKKFAIIFLSVLAVASFALFGASCKGKERTVTFDANGGVFQDGQSQLTVTVKKGDRVTPPADPYYYGYELDGWTLGGEMYDFGKKVKSDMTLVASYNLKDTYSVTFTAAEGVTYLDADGNAIEADVRIPKGESFSFKIDTGAFYSGTPTVKANNSAITVENGLYTVEVNSNVNITVSGITRDVAGIIGSGTEEDPFRILRPIDLITMADNINGDATGTYGSAYYQLENDIDMKGEELKVIGDYSEQYAFFSGYFNGNNHKISNFTINVEKNVSADAQDPNAPDMLIVGLFGYVQFNLADQFGGIIYGLTLDNYEINVTASGVPVYVGSVIGYGIGASALVCSATNGSVNVEADSNYFGFVGGIVGFQRAVVYNGVPYMSEVSYCTSDAELNCSAGLVYAAGGITGYIASDDQRATAYIDNSYYTGTVSGSIMAGGIAGYMGEGTSVTTSYSVGDVNAYSSLNQSGSSNEDAAFLSRAYAGGIAGFAENFTIISDSFFAGYLYGYAAGGASATRVGTAGDGLAGDIRAAGSSDAFSDSTLFYNSYTDNSSGVTSSSFTSPDFLHNTLNWKDVDWVIKSGIHPTINHGEESFTFTAFFKFSGYTNDEGGDYGPTLEIEDTYRSLAAYVADGYVTDYWGIDSRLFVEVAKHDGDVAYGFFFDEACTRKIPYSYVFTRDITVYVGFKDVRDIADTYYAVSGGGEIEIVLGTDGTFRYTDGSEISETKFVYDGENIYISSVRLARYSSYTLGTDEESDLSDKMLLRNFGGRVSGGVLTVWDGTYYTHEAPFTARIGSGINGEFYVIKGTSKQFYTFLADGSGYAGETPFTYQATGDSVTITMDGRTISATLSGGTVTSIDGAEAHPVDAFKGSWEFSATAPEYFVFDGAGSWSRYFGGREQAHGSYTVEGGKATLDNGLIASMSDGRLVLDNGDGYTSTLGTEGSYQGMWQNTDTRITLSLEGVGKDGRGNARIDYTALSVYYNLTYAPELGSGYVAFYFGSEYFGRLRRSGNALTGYLYYASGLTQVTLYCMDDYYGTWLSDGPLFDIVDFNGFGIFATAPGAPALNGYITIDGEEIPYSLDEDMKGTFTYNGEEYSMEYSWLDGKVTVRYSGGEFGLYRKDAFAESDLVTVDGSTRYSFDGRGRLEGGGKLTVTGDSPAEYGYRVDGDTANIYNLSDGKISGDIIATLSKGANAYEWSPVNGNITQLLIATPYMGVWAISDEFGTFDIGGMWLDNSMIGTYLGEPLDDLTYSADGYLSFTTTYYYWLNIVYVIPVGLDTNGDGRLTEDEYEGIAISEAQTLTGDYTLAYIADELYAGGTLWRNSEGTSIRFDGASGLNIYDGYSGYADLRARGGSTPTEYGYARNGDEFYMWTLYGQSMIFKLELLTDWEDEFGSSTSVYVSEDGSMALRRTRVDMLYGVTAYTEDGLTSYTFDGNGYNSASGPATKRGNVTVRHYDGEGNVTSTEVLEYRYTAGINAEVHTIIIYKDGELNMEVVQTDGRAIIRPSESEG